MREGRRWVQKRWGVGKEERLEDRQEVGRE